MRQMKTVSEKKKKKEEEEEIPNSHCDTAIAPCPNIILNVRNDNDKKHVNIRLLLSLIVMHELQ